MRAWSILAALLMSITIFAAPAPTPTDSSSGGVNVSIPLIAGVNDGGGDGGSRGGGPGGGRGGGGGSGGGGNPGVAHGGTVCTVIGPPAAPVPPSVSAKNAQRLIITPPEAAQGAQVSFHLGGFQAGEKVQVVSYPGARVLGEVTVRGDGTVDSKIGVPANLPTGMTVIEATGWLDCRVGNGSLLVVSASGSGVSFMPESAWIFSISGLALAGICLLIAVQLGWLPGLGRMRRLA